MKRIIFLLVFVLISTIVQADQKMLNDVLAEKANESSVNMSDEVKQLVEKLFINLEASGILKNAKNTGDIAPNFNLLDQNGNSIELYELLEKGPVILMWYRGVWCPYCNLTLRYYQEELQHFEEYGATLVAISSQLPDMTLSTAEKNELDYTVVSDVDGVVGKDYGVIFSLDAEMAALYKNYGIDLELAQGNTRNELPLAATYIIDTNKMIRFTFLDIDYKKRAEPKNIISTLNQLKN